MKKKLFVLFSMCFLVLVGCGSSDNSNQTNAEQNNKFIGAWQGQSRKYCCISSSGKAYIGIVEGGEMSVEGKQIFEYEIDGNTINLKNDVTSHSLELKDDELVEKDGTTYYQTNKSVSINSDEKDESHLLDMVERKE